MTTTFKVPGAPRQEVYVAISASTDNLFLVTLTGWIGAGKSHLRGALTVSLPTLGFRIVAHGNDDVPTPETDWLLIASREPCREAAVMLAIRGIAEDGQREAA